MFEGVSDSVVLSDMLAWPEPSNPDVTTQSVGHDTRTGVAETLMHAYVNANCGPGAPAARRKAGLVMGTDRGRGPTVTKNARFPVLGELLTELGTVAGLGFRVVQRGAALAFETFPIRDRRSEIRLDVRAGTLAGQRVAVSPPGVTRVIVAGQGDLEDRTFVGVDSASSVTGETDWGRRIERFIDQRNTDDADELKQAGDEVLADEGATVTAVQVVPVEDSAMRYGYDWSIGDSVTVVVDDQELASTVTGLVLKADTDGFRLGATLGDPTGFDATAASASRAQSTESRVSALERTAEATPPGARVISPTGYTQATPPTSYPQGETTEFYLSASDATAGGWDFGGKWGYVNTRAWTGGDSVQTWRRVHANATSHEMWVRGGNASGWSPWREVAFENVLTAASFTASTLPTTYPDGKSVINMQPADSTAGAWPFAGQYGVLESRRNSNDVIQRWTRRNGSGSTPFEMIRTGNSSGWGGWRTPSYVERSPRGIVSVQALASTAYIGDTETIVYSQTFTAEANRCYEINFRVAVVDTDATGDNASSTIRYAKQSGYTACRWAAGSTASNTSTLLGTFYNTLFDDDSFTATGINANWYLNNPPAGTVTIGIGLKVNRAAATYGQVRYLVSGGSHLAIEDVGSSI